MRHFDAAEVVELVGLPEACVARRGRRALHDGERIGADRFVDFRPPRGELLGRKVGRERREALLGEERRDQGRGEPEGEQGAMRHESLLIVRRCTGEQRLTRKGGARGPDECDEAESEREETGARVPGPRRLVTGKLSKIPSSATPDT